MIATAKSGFPHAAWVEANMRGLVLPSGSMPSSRGTAFSISHATNNGRRSTCFLSTGNGPRDAEATGDLYGNACFMRALTLKNIGCCSHYLRLHPDCGLH